MRCFDEIKNFLVKEMELHGSLNTWWMSDFYNNYCQFMGIEQITVNTEKINRSIRYYLNKMVNLGVFECFTCGTGYLGKTDFGATHFKTWFFKKDQKDQP